MSGGLSADQLRTLVDTISHRVATLDARIGQRRWDEDVAERDGLVWVLGMIDRRRSMPRTVVR